LLFLSVAGPPARIYRLPLLGHCRRKPTSTIMSAINKSRHPTPTSFLYRQPAPAAGISAATGYPTSLPCTTWPSPYQCSFDISTELAIHEEVEGVFFRQLEDSYDFFGESVTAFFHHYCFTQ
jgi:hypothetical protein